jgi:hypothetical protein
MPSNRLTPTEIISKSSIERRILLQQKIQQLSGHFANDSRQLEQLLSEEVLALGVSTLLDHLRLCGDIPEFYRHDSTEEKLYSKYTDAILCEAYKAIGLRSIVLRERGDAADVESFASNYSFVADAKSFRLSRTAKNQKDFKIQAMDGWKRGKPYAMVVCPIYHLPSTSSQIYEQASTRDVCIFTYSHLAVLLNFAFSETCQAAEDLLQTVFQTVSQLNPSKNAAIYWQAINRSMLSYSPKIEELWKNEKIASVESMAIAKESALTFLALEREKIMRMSHDDALKELLNVHKIESKVSTITRLSNNDILMKH